MPTLAVVTVCSCTVLPLARAGADQLSSEQAKASQIEAEISSTGQRIDALDQEFEAAKAHKASIDQQISDTQTRIDQTRTRISSDQATLRVAAVNAYVTDGAVNDQDPLFDGNQMSVSETAEYNLIAEGDVGTAVSNLQTAQNQLNAQQALLKTQDQQAAQAVSEANTAYADAQSEEQTQQVALNQVKGQIATLIAQQQQAAEAAAATAARARLAAASAAVVSTDSSYAPPPPPVPGGGGAEAVQAALSQVGVPYVWGGESPRGTPGDPSGGFDCSGLVAWAWGQAGVSLPHYSGAQMADSTPVPISDLSPGDLLFYGPGGSEHVAMYIGGGQMVEAPYTGATVWVTALRLGDGFAGAGRP